MEKLIADIIKGDFKAVQNYTGDLKEVFQYKGENVNILYIACQCDNTLITNYLINQGLDYDIMEILKYCKKKSDITDLLLNYTYHNELKHTALFIIYETKNIGCLKKLIKYGANVNHKDVNGMNVVEYMESKNIFYNDKKSIIHRTE